VVEEPANSSQTLQLHFFTTIAGVGPSQLTVIQKKSMEIPAKTGLKACFHVKATGRLLEKIDELGPVT
jgi:hypothetical protein